MMVVPRYRDLLTQTLAGETAPICPVFAHCHHPIADQDAEALAAATLAWQARFDLDLVKLTPASTWQLRDYGVEDAHDPSDALGRRRIVRTVVKDPDDWYRLAPLAPGDGFTARIVQAGDRLRRRLPPTIPLLATLYSPVSLAAKLAPPGTLARHRTEAPEAVAAGLTTLTDNCRRLVSALTDVGVDGIFLAVQSAQASLVTSDDYARLGLSGDLACLVAASALPFNVLHLHGDKVHHHLFRDAPAALIHYNMSPGNPLPTDFQPQPGLSTGPDPDGVITHGTVRQCVDEVRRILDRFAGPGFVLAPGCSLPLAVSVENLDAMIALARTPHQQYPFS
ncbi:hypothetical protein IP70_13060 [alpha proteobacterium AAP38]|nr:hypothetical protein IP70_13060 [alpha proteobacterium AAP38]